MKLPAGIKLPPGNILRNETEWAIRESMVRANEILGPNGVIVSSVIPALVAGITAVSHSSPPKAVPSTVANRHVEQVKTIVQEYVQTDALQLLERTRRIANRSPRRALDETQEVLDSFNERWDNLLEDLFRVYIDVLTELFCDWASLGPKPPSSLVTIRSLAKDVCSLQPEELATVFYGKLGEIAKETGASESRLIESFSLCQSKWLEAVAKVSKST